METLHDLFIRRHSIRRYTDQEISPEDVKTILEAGLLSPSSKSSRPWQFVLVDDKDMLARLAECKAAGARPIAGCALAIVVVASPEKTDMYVEDMSIAAAYMHLQAAALGLGSCWIQIRNRFTADDEPAEDIVRELLGIPADMIVECILTVGYPDEERRPVDPSKLLWEKVHVERWKPSQEVPTIAIVGAGNVATRLALAFHAAGAKVVSVSAAHEESAKRLAELVEADAKPVSQIAADVDYVVIAVSDKAVADVVEAMSETDAVVVHTSGSVPMQTLAQRFSSAGVLYPLQTFSRDVDVNVADVPFFTEATDADVLASVDDLAHLLSRHVYHADSEQRKSLHVAGVLTSNFPIYLLEIARQALAKAGYPLEVVAPLARVSIEKAFAVGPRDALTGPARRGAVAVTELQARSLSPMHRAIYEAITQAIFKDYHE